MEHVKTIFGTIPISALPVVETESQNSMLFKCMVFYSIIAIILLVIFLQTSPKSKNIDIPNEINFNKFESHILADSIEVYNPNEQIYLENIILIDTSNNLINIDITQNPHVKIYKKFNGLSYQINLGSAMEIKEIGFISDIDRFIKYVNADMHLQGKKVWSFCGYLEDKRENFLKLSEYLFDFTKPEAIVEKPTSFTPSDQKKEILITNDHILGIKLMESSECYVNY